MTEETTVPTDAEKEQAAKEFAEAFGAFYACMERCALMGVDIVAELEKQGMDVPPAFALMFGS